MFHELAAVLVHGQRERDDARVEDGAEEVTRAGELPGLRRRGGVLPELEILVAGAVLVQDGVEGLVVSETKNPDAHDGEERGHDHRVEDLLPFEGQRESCEVHQDVEGQMQGHSIA